MGFVAVAEAGNKRVPTGAETPVDACPSLPILPSIPIHEKRRQRRLSRKDDNRGNHATNHSLSRLPAGPAEDSSWFPVGGPVAARHDGRR